MVAEFFLDLVWKIVKPLIDLMPSVTLNVTTESLRFFMDAYAAVAYVFPVADIMIMIGIVISITIFRIIISFIKTIWELLPIL